VPGTYLTSINILALQDTGISIQLSLAFPPDVQFQPGDLTNSRIVTLNRKNSFTLDCSELTDNTVFIRSTLSATYYAGYAIIDSTKPLVVFDFISVTTPEGIAPDIEVIEIKESYFPQQYGSYGGTGSGYYGQGQGSYGQDQGNYGQGQGNYGQGQGSYGQGQGNYGQGQGSYGQGQGSYGQGQGSYSQGQGSRYYGQGQGSYGQGQGNYGQGQGSYGQGQGSYGQGQGTGY